MVFHIGALIKKYYSIMPLELKYGRIIGQLLESRLNLLTREKNVLQIGFHVDLINTFIIDSSD